MSPYLVTTSHVPEHDGATGYVVFRVADATLEEAIDGVKDWLWANTHPAATTLAAVEALPESGGSVGPLPDGTVIEVERVNLSALYPDAMYGRAADWKDEALVIDAFNARQAS